MRIGEFARCVGVSVRTVRHYEVVGLLRPSAVDPHTGYRSYGADELARAIQIEQLKAIGMRLGEIRSALGDDAALRGLLERRREHVRGEIARRRGELAMIDAVVRSGSWLSVPSLEALSATSVIATESWTTSAALTPCIRRGIQRLRRTVRARAPHHQWRFAARFPLDPTDVFRVEIGASHPDLVADDEWPAVEAVTVEIVGPHELLPLAYGLALAVAEQRGRTPVGLVHEEYVTLGPVPRTTVAIPVAAG
jgi:DNA-binding transcriptional MerR regulator